MVNEAEVVVSDSFEFWKNLGDLKKVAFAYIFLLLAISLIWKPLFAFLALLATFQLFFLLVTFYKGFLFFLSPKKEQEIDFSKVTHYPTFNILLANYKEKGETIEQLVANIGKINYPKTHIKAFLIIQEDDVTTLDAIAALQLPSFVELLKIHPVRKGEVQSKSRALNCALKHCHNDIVTIFDSEDEPDVNQFLKVAYLFETTDYDVVQCSIGIYNSNQNFISRFFSAEFRCFFEYLLSGIDRTEKWNLPGLYLPLGGTSFYVKKPIMQKIGHFDMFNPTEDLIFSSTVYRHGGKIGHLPSMTRGEAPVLVKQLLNQRTRWVKGFIISTCVMNRNIIATWRQIGFFRWLSFNLWTLGSVIALVSPIFFILTILWLILQSQIFNSFFPFWLSIIGFYGLMVIGTFISISIFVVASLKYKRYKDAFLTPLFLVFSNILLTIACYKALYQLITKPNMAWSKTEHGLAKKD